VDKILGVVIGIVFLMVVIATLGLLFNVLSFLTGFFPLLIVGGIGFGVWYFYNKGKSLRKA